MTFGVIYGLWDPVTGELRYVGQTKQTLRRRLAGHLRASKMTSGRYVLHWIRALQAKGLEPGISILCDAQSQTELDQEERKAIAMARALGCPLTNHDDGGRGSCGRKLSKAHRAKLHNPEVWARMAATRRGQPSPRKGVCLGATTRAKISEAKKGNKCHYYGHIHNEDLADLRGKGWSLREIGSHFGISKTMVAKRLHGEA